MVTGMKTAMYIDHHDMCEYSIEINIFSREGTFADYTKPQNEAKLNYRGTSFLEFTKPLIISVQEKIWFNFERICQMKIIL